MGYNNSLQGRYKADVKASEQWRDFIKEGRNKFTRPVANNTTARIVDNGVAIKLHATDIVTVLDNGDMVLNSGGWLSSTTKERINRYTNAGISQKNSVWYLSDGSLFYDGMIIKSDGTPKAPKQPAKYEAKLKVIKAKAKVYAKAYVKELKAGNIDMPGGGDCWYCLFIDKQGNGSSDHISEHIKDSYFVPSLLVNAGRAAGYQDHQIGLMGIGGQRLFIDPERNIYKYVVKQLQRGL